MVGFGHLELVAINVTLLICVICFQSLGKLSVTGGDLVRSGARTLVDWTRIPCGLLRRREELECLGFIL